MASLIVHATCSRHIRRNETACPFCGDAVASDIANTPERAMPTARLSRAALFAFATATVGAVACNSGANMTAAYGGPPPPMPGTGGTVGSGGATSARGNGDAGGATGAGGNASASGGTASTLQRLHHGGHPPRPHYGGAPPPDGKPPQL